MNIFQCLPFLKRVNVPIPKNLVKRSMFGYHNNKLCKTPKDVKNIRLSIISDVLKVDSPNGNEKLKFIQSCCQSGLRWI